jgi:H+/Cl- antiporter ClcA
LTKLTPAAFTLLWGGGSLHAQSFFDGKTGGLDTGEVVVVLQTSPRAFPDLPGVPLAQPLAKFSGNSEGPEGLDRMIAEAFALDPALVAKLKDILYQ